MSAAHLRAAVDAASAPDMLLRPPPHSIEAESSVLGALLLNAAENWPRVRDVLTVRSFYRHEHGVIYGAICTLAGAGEAVDVISTLDHLRDLGLADEVGGIACLNALAQYMPDPQHVVGHARTIQELAALRAVAGLGDELAAAALRRDRLALRNAAEGIVALRLDGDGVVYPGQGRAPLSSLTLDMAELARAKQPPPAFIIPEWLPEGSVTLMAAHGEGGKSQLSLYIAVSLAAGLPVLGHPAQAPRRVLVYSCEDRRPVLGWRVQQYCAALGVAPESLAGWLFVIDAGELESPELFVEQRGSPGAVTPAYEDLRQYMSTGQIDVVVIDNASDTYAANEINRPSVRAFIRALQRLLPTRDAGAVLLLAHVNRNASTTKTGGQQYSGSTAWHNSVRSRWELTRGKSGDDADSDEQDAVAPGAPYVLRRVKNNYAASDSAGLQFHWNHLHGVILPDDPGGPLLQAIDQRNDQREVLAVFAEARALGQRISASPRANNNAAKVAETLRPAMSRRLRDMKRLQPVLRALQREGLIDTQEYTGAKHAQKTEWVLTAQGIEAAAP